MSEMDDLKAFVDASEKVVRDFKLQTLKRWGQEKCEHCGGPLVTLFNEEGKNPIRICWPCEQAANDHDHYGQ